MNYVEKRVGTPVVPPPAAQKLEPLTPRRQRNRWPVVIGITAFSIGAGVAAIYWLRELRPAPPAVVRSVTLALHVEPSSNGLMVLWDRSSREITSADRAVLSIREGRERKALVLDRSQIRSGAISYKPEGQDVEFELEIFQGPKGIAKDALHVFLSGSPLVASDTSPDRQVREPDLPAATSQRDENARAVAPLQTKDPNASVPKPAVAKQFLPPQSRAPASSLGAVNGQPSNALDGVEAPLNPTTSNPVTSVLRFPILTEPPQAKTQPTPAPPAPQPPASKPYAAAPEPPMKYTAPTVVQRVSPLVPVDIRSHMRSDIEVDVIVVIDMTGQVTDAHVLKTRGDLPALVTPEALRAARQFRFKPAMENDRAIRSAMVLSFQFRR